jgi:hypothetical protein
MDQLPHHHLTTLTLDVDFANIVPIGATPAGRRGIAPVTGGRFEGARLSGTVCGGQDWFLGGAEGLAIDVRLTLTTDDGVQIYLAYQGRMRGSAEAMQRFRKGEQLAAGEYSLHIVARFECGDPRYSWLDDVLAVGVGEQTASGPIYRIFEIGTP